jgi:NADH-quinone oxidoreductase subunit G
VRDEDGHLVPTSWPEAVSIAAAGLAAAGSSTAVLTGGRLTLEDAYSYAKFARAVLGTDDIDFRARPASAEEAAFLAALVAGRPVGPTYADLEKAPVVVLAGLDAEDESPIVFLRLRKAARKGAVKVFSVAPFASTGITKLKGSVLTTVPGAEAATLDALADETDGSDSTEAARLLRQPGAVLLVGERLAQSPGALSAAARLAAATGAQLGWVPRRAGERGALDAGALAGLLPGGRPLDDDTARAGIAAAWGIDAATLPTTPGRDLEAVVAALHADAEAIAAATDPSTVTRSVGALLVAGVEVDDLADPAGFRTALEAAPFVVSLEQRHSEVTVAADVVLPVAAVAEKLGTFVDWEGRPREFAQVFRDALTLSDSRVLAMLADELDAVGFGRGDIASLRAEIRALGPWDGVRAEAPSAPAEPVAQPDAGEAVLATWRQLLDRGLLQEGDPYLGATARSSVARLSPATAAAVGVADGGELTVATDAGSLTLPLVVTAMPDGVVWLPANSDGSTPRLTLGAGHGDVVRISGGAA